MYTRYWGLQRRPFENNPDPSFFVRSNSHQAALLKLRYLVENRLGLGMLSGDVGSGKSTVAAMLAEELPSIYRPVVSVVYPRMTAAEMLAYLAAELGAPDFAGQVEPRPLDVVLRHLHAELRRHAGEGRSPVILIDESHLIDDPDLFQSLRLLLNFRQPPRVDFTLIFLGDLSLPSQIQRIAALDDRMGVKCLLQPLSSDETENYIIERLAASGSRRSPFNDSALTAIQELSGGLPRRINRLCDLSLLVAYADGLEWVTEREVESVAEELATVIAD